MNNLSPAVILEKNKIANDQPFLALLEIQIPHIPEPIRIVHNNEDIEWPSGTGNIWQAVPFQIDEVTEDGKEISQINVKVCNVDRTVSQYLEASSGATGTCVTFRLVHAAHLDLTEPELEEDFSVIKAVADMNWATFTIGPDFYTNQRVPWDVYLKDYCPYHFKDLECTYNGAETTCNHTLTRCRALNNSKRFGGEASLIPGGFYDSSLK